MSAPRLEIDLAKLHHNACTLVRRLGDRGIQVTGITKATLGSPEIASTLIRAGVADIGDSRIENLEAMCDAQIAVPMTLIRSPMLSQVDRVVAYADVSFNTELDVIGQLSRAAHEINRTHGVVLMVELGDLREGIMPSDLECVVRKVLRLPNITLKGIGTNLACRSGVSPDVKNMAELSVLADSLEATFDISLMTISGGNSASLEWALSHAETGRVNNLRLGESLLLGCEPLRRQPIEGLYTDVITLVAEVIESKIKPSQPWGELAQNAFGEKFSASNRGNIVQSILALGHQDTDPSGLQAPLGIKILGASSDHLVVDATDSNLLVGAEMSFQMNYSALVRAMTSPFVMKHLKEPNIIH
ncbi:MAG: alanine/ornithine racemase family PLP-dependent enzyme [Sedimenticola sp.]|nr:alanine/ornithine racemase family PLP-dependent enzyme [Sedimenticola sp.]